MEESDSSGVPVMLPIDVLVAPQVKAGVRPRVVQVTSVPPDHAIVDIGPKTVEYFFGRMQSCRTIMWNGPMGVYEIPQFSLGTRSLINYLSCLDVTSV
ncbi:TPA: phosphoglycerate kinase, partial [Candidatus Bathyarchaeota archaeon]|nr:phosphoglycerate kinase [Candidatus Bathyarchaeota archaeon]